MVTTVRQHLSDVRPTHRNSAPRTQCPWTLIIWTVILAGCSDDVTGPPEPVAASLEILEAPATLLRSDTVRLTAVAKDSAGADITPSLVWVVDDGAVASVNSSGLVTGRAEGTTTIRVAAGALSDSISLTVTEGMRFTMLSPGGDFTCGLDSGGAVYCWGINWTEQLGVQTTTHRCVPIEQDPGRDYPCSPRPVRAEGSVQFATISAGGNHMCGLDSQGRAHCWGDNGWEQLGLTWDVSQGGHVPVSVSGDHAFRTLEAGGDFNCGQAQSGETYCWGSHGSGELGTGDLELFTSALPVAVVGGHQFAMLAGGYVHACALTLNGAAYCWGYNGDGALGIGRLSTQDTWWSEPTPTAVVGGLTFSQIGAGGGWSCGLTTGGAAYCWGPGSAGRLGNGATTDHTSPQLVAGGYTWRSLSLGMGGHACGLTAAGETACWGHNVHGQLGVAPTGEKCPSSVATEPPFDCSSTPLLRPATPRRFKSVTAGIAHTCALDDQGYAFCWGRNQSGQLGNGRVGGQSHIPSPVLRPE